jgi:predicted RNase H-like HicB family nuclease
LAAVASLYPPSGCHPGYKAITRRVNPNIPCEDKPAYHWAITISLRFDSFNACLYHQRKTKEMAMVSYTAKYTKIASGYMGQLVEWPEVVTEGRDLEECRTMLRDALQEMVLAYQQMRKEIPLGNALIEQIPVEIEHVGQAS